MPVPILPAIAIVRDVRICGGVILYGPDLLNVVDDNQTCFARNKPISQKEANEMILTYAHMEIELDAIQGVVLFVTTQQFHVIWRNEGGNFFVYIGFTPYSNIEESEYTEQFINNIEKYLQGR